MASIQQKRGAASSWSTQNPVLSAGEIGFELDTGKFKIGDGTSDWSSLSYFSTTAGGGSGTVTSVDISLPTGLSVTGNPITTSGTLAVTFSSGYSIPTTASQTNWDTGYTDRLKWDGGSTGLTASTGRTSLGATTVGSNLFTLTNPSAITFLRVNADNSVSALDASTFRTAIGAGTSSTTGTVTTVSVVTANGFAGTVANATTTPAITLTTSITGLLSGNGTAISAASAGYGDTTNPYASKTANYFLAAPNGSAGSPTFRAIVSADIPTLNQNTTGSAATLTTTRTLWGQNFNGSANVTGNLTSVGDITGSTAMAITAGTASNISLNAGSIAGTTGTGGTVTIASGNGGSTSGAGGAISIDTGSSIGVGGAISIGTSQAASVTIGRTGITTTIVGTLSASLSTLTISSPLSGTSYNGSSAVSIGLSSGYGDTQNPYASKTANYFLAAPDGSSGSPSFRAIVAADIPTLNQNTTGSAATLTTSRSIWGQTFNGSANVTGSLTSVANITGSAGNSMTITSATSGNGTLTLLSAGSGGITIGGTGSGAGAISITSPTQSTLNVSSGSITIQSGNQTGGGVGSAGTITIDTGSSSGLSSSMNIGTTNAGTISIGRPTTGTTLIYNPLLGRINATDEGGQINFARASDNTQYWYLDSFGSSSTPSLRFVENATTQVQIDTGGVVNLSGTLKTRSNGTAANSAPIYFGSSSNLLSSATAGAMEYNDITTYVTPANGGRAVDMLGHFYVLSSQQGTSETQTTASMLDGGTLGITVAAGTTYQIEVFAPIQHTYLSSTTATTSFGLTTTTVTGSPTVSYNYQLRYGSNTTGFTTASADNVISRTTGSQLVGAAITTGSRYIQCHLTGILRVTGTGTVKIYPAISQSVTGNPAYAQSGSYFKLTPIGNGTVNSVGNWA